MMSRTSNLILEMQFKPLTKKADELLTAPNWVPPSPF